MTRKVKLTRSDVEMAKHFNVPLEEVAKKKLPKRGRPVGSKNKPAMAKFEHQAYTITNKNFDDTLKAWETMEAEASKVNWEEVAKKQEDKLAMYIAENDELARICIMRWDEIQNLKYLVKYLEGKNEDYSV